MGNTLQVGDRVTPARKNGVASPDPGEFGTVVGFGGIDTDCWVYVSWDIPDHTAFHDCDGLCEFGYGWGFFYYDLQKVDDSDLDDMSDLLSLL